ncbi:patatin-like phospholipase/acyl hydrolase [Planomicrobium sp. HSC-17F08]|nr:patatin-like phospholipase/acyl hydrolase [Planomicrobium sp. HSC-17F08]
MKKILSIDGGGIRGIIPARILADIERRTKKQTHELFDLIVGTSTGGIIALGLVKPDSNKTGSAKYGAQEISKLYEERGEDIFSPAKSNRWNEKVRVLLEQRYESEGIESVLKEFFRDTKLSASLKEVLVVCYEIEMRKPWIFKSKKAKSSEYEGLNHNAYMWEIARATSSAPTYFDPPKIKIEDEFSFVDGGLYANNPAMCAYVEAKTMFKEEKDFLIVSLGTGEQTRPIPHEEAINWGLIEWWPAILDIVFDGVSSTIDYQLAQLLPPRKGKQRYYRFQTRLIDVNDNLDDVSPRNIEALKRIAKILVEQKSESIEELCRQLTAK